MRISLDDTTSSVRRTVAAGASTLVSASLTKPACRTGRRSVPCRSSFGKGHPIATGSKEEKIEMEGEVVEALRNGFFRIALDNGHETLGYTAGKMRRYRIRIFPGDRIKVELSAYDLGRGRIVYRYRD